MGLNWGQRSRTWPCFGEQGTWSNLVSEYKVGVKHWLLVVGDIRRCYPSFDVTSSKVVIGQLIGDRVDSDSLVRTQF